MKTVREKELEKDYRELEIAYMELKDRYDQLCGKLRKNAKEARDNYTIYNYGKDRGGPWN